MAMRCRQTLAALALLLSACASRVPAEASPAPPGGWRNALLYVASVDYGYYYALRSDGTFTRYGPNAVDGNPAPCSTAEREKNNWCMADGRLHYEAPDRVLADPGDGAAEAFRIQGDGTYCYVPLPGEEMIYERNCETENVDAATFRREHGLE
jgi:hypothetical protein